MIARIGCIVEGHGDVEAAPIVIRRIAARIDPARVIHIPAPIRTSRDKIVKAGELERAVTLASRKLGGYGAVLVLLDSEDDCPARLGPELGRRAAAIRGDLPLAVVLAKREFEAWFLAAAESLRGLRGLAADLQPPPDPEAIRGAKEWLRNRMPPRQRYVETLDQPALAAQFSLDAARAAPSFDKLYREVARLIEELRVTDETNATGSNGEQSR